MPCVAKLTGYENRHKKTQASNSDILCNIQGSPSGCGRLEIPGVSEVAKGEHKRPHEYEPV